ncbi:hypothetical protein [Gordonia shandongensis]|uniref:hypothetical protein n=1 Tax=Gordonia shandongensis TaxID=376351 RepID=UPI0003FAB9D6|nr:hypothetical protein [Gordonia shandongensis]
MSENQGELSSLTVDDRAGTTWELTPHESFTIGREGDLAFPDNPYLHRRLLLLTFHAGFWWVANVGRYIPVKIIDLGSGAQTVLRSGSSSVLAADALAVFDAGPTTYEVGVRVTAAPTLPRPSPTAVHGRTLGHAAVTPDQFRLLVAMAEPLLRHPGTGLDRMPTIPAVAERLGWSVTKANRHLDRLCERLADGGVSGLVSDGRTTAVNRRMRLLEYALDSRLVTREALSVLDE